MYSFCVQIDGASKLTALRNRYYPEDPKIRTIALALLINTFGNGLFGTLEVIYFTRVVGLTPAQIGLGLSIAGGISLLFSIPAGQIPIGLDIETLPLHLLR